MPVTEITSAEQFKLVLSSNHLVVVDFHAQWCGPCKVIAPKYSQFSEQYIGKIAFVKIDVDQVPEVTSTCQVSAMPTFQFYKDGQKVDELIGADPRSLEAKITKLAA